MNPTAIIVDDESNLASHLEKKLAQQWPELEVLGSAVNGRQALALAAETQPDIVFLDIHMPGLTGLHVAEELKDKTKIVFITAFDQYAVQAFEHAAVDYLLKPVTDERLAQCVAKLQTLLPTSAASQPATELDLSALLNRLQQNSDEYIQWLRAGLDDTVELVAVNDVVYFQADQKYTSVFTQAREYFIRTPIKELEQSLDPNAFWRIHRGIIVAVGEIMSAKRDLRGRYTLTLKSRPEKLRSSQSYSHQFRQM